MNRRTFLGAASAVLGDAAAGEPAHDPAIPVIDAHIHLFDTSRPQGVPWPAKDDKVLYHSALPSRYLSLARPFGIVGAIEIECSAWLEDNQWVLDVAAHNPVIVGMIGDLEPADPAFGAQLERFHANPLFLGIRYGNLWGRDLGARLEQPAFLEGVRLVQKANLTFDSANPTPELIKDLLHLSRKIPDLRIVVDHLAQLDAPPAGPARAAYEADLKELASNPHVFVKISQVLRRVDGAVPTALSFYRDRMEAVFELFGEDRVLYGSDWPNSDQWGSYAQVFGLAESYFATKSRPVREKYFWRNSLAAYRWVKRESNQPA